MPAMILCMPKCTHATHTHTITCREERRPHSRTPGKARLRRHTNGCAHGAHIPRSMHVRALHTRTDARLQAQRVGRPSHFPAPWPPSQRLCPVIQPSASLPVPRQRPRAGPLSVTSTLNLRPRRSLAASRMCPRLSPRPGFRSSTSRHAGVTPCLARTLRLGHCPMTSSIHLDCILPIPCVSRLHHQSMHMPPPCECKASSMKRTKTSCSM